MTFFLFDLNSVTTQLQVVEIKIISDSDILKYGSDFVYCYEGDYLVDKIYLGFSIFCILLLQK